MDRTKAMETFCRVVERSSLTAAATELEITGAAISRQLAKLEARLGAKLLHRTTRRVSPTEAGRQYYEAALVALREVARAERVVTDARGIASGRLRISAPMSFGVAHLASIVAQFSARHSRIEVDMILDDSVVDIVSGHFDVALRIRTALPDSTLFARPLATIRRVMCASPDYLERHRSPASVVDLREHNCLSYTLASDLLHWTLIGPNGKPATVRACGNLKFNNSLALASAAKAGAGIAVLPFFVAEPDLREGRLVEVLPGYAPPAHRLSAVHAHGTLPPAALRAFLDFVGAELKRREKLGLL